MFFNFSLSQEEMAVYEKLKAKVETTPLISDWLISRIILRHIY